MIQNLEKELVKQLTKEIVDREDEYIKYILHTYAQPIIKGNITKGKLKWRGIKMIIQQTNFGYEKWIEQRGIMLGNKMIYNYIL